MQSDIQPGYRFASPEAVMTHALALAAQGQGTVEPNPMVGAVLVDSEFRLIADGFHRKFGGPHAEKEAFDHAGNRAQGATLFVTLEPCAHHGKQPPCADAVITAGVARVICAMRDPFPQVAGQGIARIRAAGISVDVGLCEREARDLNAPFLTRVIAGRPYVIAKYAMTLDGKMATSTGHSMWISSEESRADVHRTRGRVDAVIVGAGTAAADNPKLSARPPGKRTPLRVVMDRSCRSILPDGHLVTTAGDIPVCVYHTDAVLAETRRHLIEHGVELVEVASDEAGQPSVADVLADLGKRGATNVLLEGGATILGRFRDNDAIDEFHIYIAPKVIGKGLSPLSGPVGGLDEIPSTANVSVVKTELLGGDIAVRAIVDRAWRHAAKA